MTNRVQGSIKNKIVATELVEERAKCNFDQEELYNIYYSDPNIREMRQRTDRDIDSDPILANTHKYYEWTPKEI